MPYVTSIERNAEERGLEKGIEKGREEAGAALVLVLLKRPCGPLPFDVEQQVRQLSFDQIQALGEVLFDFKSLTDLKTWLNTKNH